MFEIEQDGYFIESSQANTCILPESVTGTMPHTEHWTVDDEENNDPDFTDQTSAITEWLESIRDYTTFDSRDEVVEVEYKSGYFGRWSMGGGYLDCSDWHYADSEEELTRKLIEAYGTDEDAEEFENELEATGEEFTAEVYKTRG